MRRGDGDDGEIAKNRKRGIQTCWSLLVSAITNDASERDKEDNDGKEVTYEN